MRSDVMQHHVRLLGWARVTRNAMTTMSFSIPDDLAEAFSKALTGKDASAVTAESMRRAVAEREPVRRTTDLVERVRRIRARLRGH
jgi:hypothetical protein